MKEKEELEKDPDQADNWEWILDFTAFLVGLKTYGKNFKIQSLYITALPSYLNTILVCFTHTQNTVKIQKWF